MAPWNLSLIQTKMAPPRPPRFRVARRTLSKKLAATAEHAVTLVIAPAGFGKTTTLSEWCEVLRTRHQLVAWLSLHHDDDHPDQLGAYLVASLNHGTGGVGQQAEKLLRHDPMTPGKTVISVLLNEIAACGKPVFLILDDFDRLTSPRYVRWCRACCATRRRISRPARRAASRGWRWPSSARRASFCGSTNRTCASPPTMHRRSSHAPAPRRSIAAPSRC